MVNERHHIYLERLAGKPKPWSEDEIFQNWKFCNIFRRLDKQSQFLMQDVIGPHLESSPGMQLFNTFAFRAFNLDEVFTEITEGNNWFSHWNEESTQRKLWARVLRQKQITSGAYMIRGFVGIGKWKSIPIVLSDIWRDKDALAKEISKRRKLQFATELFLSNNYWGWGSFTCYQVALDLSYTPILENPEDINSWCVFGPGAIRGLEILWPDIKKNEYFEYTKRLLDMQGKWLKGYMPIMTLQDIEFSLCEFQKYWRAFNGGRMKERYNGKVS